MVRRKKSILPPILALIMSCGVGMVFVSMINSKDTKAVIQEPRVKSVKTIIKQAPTVKILTAKDDIKIGTRISSEHFMWRAWPENLLSSEYITKNGNEKSLKALSGGIVKVPLIKGEPIIANKIVLPGDRGAMAVLLRKGMRAISVPISVISSAGGFILPGDRVDVLYTASLVRENFFRPKITAMQQGNNIQIKDAALANYINLKKKFLSRDAHIKDTKLSNTYQGKNLSKKEQKLLNILKNEKEVIVANGSQFTELLLENVRILAIDQDVSSGGDSALKSIMGEKRQETSSLIGASATLEVTPQQAKLLAWSVSSGQLTLSLRSLDGEANIKDDALPVTKTSFAWPIDEVIGDFNQEMPTQANQSVQIMRGGRVSVINPNSQGGTNVVR